MKHQAWLTLAHAYVSVTELLALKDRFGDIDTIVEQSEQRLRDAGLAEKKAKAVSSPDQKGIEAALLWLGKDTHNIVTYGTDEYPEMLTQLMNRGSGNGLSVGDVLSVFQTGRVVEDRVSGGKVKLPDEVAGTIMVFKTYDRISYGLVMEATQAIHMHDSIRNPI